MSTDERRQAVKGKLTTAYNTAENPPSEHVMHHVRREFYRKHVLLATAIVTAKGSNGCDYPLRILLDNASECNFTTTLVCERLGILLAPVQESVTWLGEMSYPIKFCCQLNLRSRINDFQLNSRCLVVPKITCNLPKRSISISIPKLPHDGKLADPFFHESRGIDALIGAEFFFKILQHGKLELEGNSLVFQNSLLGWLVSGSIRESSDQSIPESSDQSIIESSSKVNHHVY